MRARIALMLFIISALLIQSSSAQEIEVYQVIRGTYQVMKSGETSFANGAGVGEMLSSGDILKSLQDSYLKIEFPGFNTAIIGPETEILFREIEGSILYWYIPFELFKGTVLIEKGEIPSLISVKTPNMISNLDSEVIIQVTDESTSVYVIDGRATILDSSMMALFSVDSGRMTLATNDSITSPDYYDEEYVQQLQTQLRTPGQGGTTDGQGTDFVQNITGYIPYIVVGIVAVVVLFLVYKFLSRRRYPY